MLQHRLIDEEKRKGSWVAKLLQSAQYTIESTPSDQFSSAKGSDFSEKMQSRALAEILPNLFEVAQFYEDHFATHRHYEGSGISDPGTGKYVTWQPLMRPPRPPVAAKKRLRRTRPRPASRSELDTDISEDETEIDDSLTSSYLRNDRLAPKQNDVSKNAKITAAQDQILPSCREVTAAGLRNCPCSITRKPNDSFGQAMQGLVLGEEMDLDLKMIAHTPMSNHIYTNDSQPVQYFASQSNYSPHTVHLQQDGYVLPSSSQSMFASATASVCHGLPAFDTQLPLPVDNGTFHDDTCFAHNYNMYSTSSANTLDFLGEIHNHASVSC